MILALDIALTCGWATSINGNIQYGHFDCGRRDNPLDLRYATWAANLDRVLATARPLRIVYEAAFQGRQQRHAGRIYGALEGIVLLRAMAIDVQAVAVNATTIKKHATGKGNATKDDMMEAVYRLQGPLKVTEDEADAICLLAYAEDHP